MKALICDVYRSPKKEGMYLYLAKAKALADLPDALMQAFGKPELAMTMALTPDKKLARVDAAKVCEQLKEPGYYLQLPPPMDEAMQTVHLQNSKFLLD